MRNGEAFSGLSVLRVARTGSTQDVVRRAAVRGAPEGFCCVTDEQSEGRGRQGRSWAAPAGTALLASVLCRRRPAAVPGIPFAAGLAAVDALLDVCGIDARLKWPNDVMVRGRKLAGILCEAEPAASTPEQRAVVVGLGVNLRVERFPAGTAAISVHEVAEPPDPTTLLDGWLTALAARLAALELLGMPSLLEAWRRQAAGMGAMVRAVTPSGAVSGIAAGLDDDGALLISTDSGAVRVLAADVHIESPPA